MSDACFYCRNSRQVPGQGHVPDPEYTCLKGLPKAHLIGDVGFATECLQFNPRIGFQMGGYYTHMWFETDPTYTPEEFVEFGPEIVQNSCLTWYIQGDGEFPIPDEEVGQPGKMLEFHLCDFTQLEDFVNFWGAELRKRGWIYDDDKDDGSERPDPAKGLG